jgi:hypothetical protein
MRDPHARFLRLILAVGSGVLLVSISASAHGAAPGGRPFVGEPVIPHVFVGDLRSLPVPPPFGPSDYVVIDEENGPEEGGPPPPPALKRRPRQFAVQFGTAERSSSSTRTAIRRRARSTSSGRTSAACAR